MNLLNFNFHLNGLSMSTKKLHFYCAMFVFVVVAWWLTQRDERDIFMRTFMHTHTHTQFGCDSWRWKKRKYYKKKHINPEKKPTNEVSLAVLVCVRASVQVIDKANERKGNKEAFIVYKCVWLWHAYKHMKCIWLPLFAVSILNERCMAILLLRLN